MRHGTKRVMFAAAFVALGAAGEAQSAWPFELRWEHDGAGVAFFEVCIDARCQAVSPQRLPNSSTWSVPVPAMAQGEHRLVVRACNSAGCTSGQPDLFIRVLPVSTGPSESAAPPPSKAKPRAAARAADS